jgi:hypothetical protein
MNRRAPADDKEAPTNARRNVVAQHPYAAFTAEDELLHDPGQEPAWNESMAFVPVDAEGSSMFLRLGRRPNEGHIEVTVAQQNQDGSLDVAFAKEKLALKTPADRRLNHAGNLCFSLIEPMKRWRLSYDGKARHIARARDFAANPRDALNSASVHDFAFDIEIEDRGPLFGLGPHGSIPGGERYLSGRHYESTLYCSGTVTQSGNRRRLDTYGFRDHSWGVRDMTRTEFTRYFWAQVDETTSIVAWFTRVAGEDFSTGIILRGGAFEVATGAAVKSVYESEPDHYVRAARLTLNSPKGDIVLDLEPICPLPLRYQKGDRFARLLEIAARSKGTGRHWPAWMEYIDLMVDGRPFGNRFA